MISNLGSFHSTNFVLQGKGGVGKSFVSSVLTQYHIEKTKSGDMFFEPATSDVRCFDTDPINNTFSRYKSFNAKLINILDENNNIDSRVFDSLIEELLVFEGTSVIDNGAATFVPFSSYEAENNAIEILQAAGKNVYMHTILTGGQALDDTMFGLKMLINTTQAPIIVWENEFFGPVERDGVPFLSSSLFLENSKRIKGVVKIHRRNPDTFGKDVGAMVESHLTFDEVMDSPAFSVMPRSRLLTIKKNLFSQLEMLSL